MRDHNGVGGVISFSFRCCGSVEVAWSQGEGAGRWLRATAAMRIAATGSSMADGPAAEAPPGPAAARREGDGGRTDS